MWVAAGGYAALLDGNGGITSARPDEPIASAFPVVSAVHVWWFGFDSDP